MQESPSSITVLHSFATFFDITAALDLKGRVIGLIGDHAKYDWLYTISLPTHNAWRWKSVKEVFDEVAMHTHYSYEGNCTVL
jgi:hypothetical protein